VATLGVAIPLETVPRLQKMLIGKANRAGKPVITATQMLRSMQDSPRPTRAEVTDVANAILDGTDAVMLSEETAIGRFPIEAVTMMGAIAADAESSSPFDAWLHRFDAGGPVPEAVARAACIMAVEIDAAAILSYTRSGATARRVAKYRPRAPIVAPTPHAETYRRLALVWGVTPLLNQSQPTTDALIDGALGAALAAACVRRGNIVVITAGLSVGSPGMTNSIRVDTL
jgi:pyruvate kinase